MRSRLLGALLVMLSVGLTASAQTQDQLQALKDTLSPDSQSSILQGVLGKGDGTGKKTDNKLKTPETVLPNTEESKDFIRRNQKTRDGRILRQYDEDPELRKDDTVTVEMIPLEDICNRIGTLPGGQNNTGNNLSNGALGNNLSGGLNALSGMDSTNSSIGGISGISGVNGVNGVNGIGGIGGIGGINGVNGINGLNGTNGYQPYSGFDVTRCPKLTDTPKTDEEKKDEEKFRKRILSNNPYQLNRFGVLELPGLPAMPVAGLTASEATRRLERRPRFRPLVCTVNIAAPVPVQPRGSETLWV